MFTTYVLFSKKYGKIYIGYSSDVKDRLISHNERANKRYTIKFRPWIIRHQLNLLYVLILFLNFKKKIANAEP